MKFCLPFRIILIGLSLAVGISANKYANAAQSLRASKTTKTLAMPEAPAVGSQIKAIDPESSKSLELGATVVAAISGIAFTAIAILFQLSGYPLQLLSRRVRADLVLQLCAVVIVGTLSFQIVGTSLSGDQLISCVRINRVLAPVALIALVGSIFRLLYFLELKGIVQHLADELIASDDL